MNVLSLWALLACITLAIHVYWSLISRGNENLLLKRSALYGHMLLGIFSIYLDEKLYEIQWTIEILQLDWGWSLQVDNLFYLVLIFATGLFFKERQIRRWTLPILSSLVALSTDDYQMTLLYCLFSYVSFFKESAESRLILFPTVLLIFMSYEKIWQTGSVLSLAQFIQTSPVGIVAMAIVALFYCYHIISLLRSESSLRASNIIVLSITQYAVFRTLPEYYSDELLMCFVIVLSLLWLGLSVLSLLSSSLVSHKSLSQKLYMGQLAICALLPVSLEFTHYVVLGLGLIPLLVQSLEEEQSNPASQASILFTSSLGALVPVSWIAIWPVYELSLATGLTEFSLVVLYVSSCLYALVNISLLKLSLDFEGLKKLGLFNIHWLFNVVLLFIFYIVPLKVLISESSSEIFNTVVSTPLYWLMFFIWSGYISYKLLANSNKEIELIKNYLTSSANGRVFDRTEHTLFSALMGLKKLLSYPTNVVFFVLKSFSLLLRDFFVALALSLTILARRISISYEQVGIGFISLFFVYFMWRYGL